MHVITFHFMFVMYMYIFVTLSLMTYMVYCSGLYFM